MSRFEKTAVTAVIAVTVLCARGQIRLLHLYIQTDHLSQTTIPIWIAGWLIATYGPIAVAMWFWRWAKRARAPWVLHSLLLPSAIILLNAGEWIMLSTIPEPDFDGTLGGPIMPAFLLFLSALGAYFVALIWRQVRRAGDHAQSR